MFDCYIKKACLLRGLSVQLLMVLIAGLNSRLLALRSLWLGSIAARPTFYSNTDIKFQSSLSRCFISHELLENNGEQLEKSALKLEICLRKV